MAEILFYHLERTKLEQVLPDLLSKTLARNWRAVVRVGEVEKLDPLDEHLWTYDDESFLPHASSGMSEQQSIWLTVTDEMPNKPDLLFLVEGAVAELSELSGLVRCILIFDGYDDAALSKARSFWKELKSTDHDATYWRQSDAGRWEKQA